MLANDLARREDEKGRLDSTFSNVFRPEGEEETGFING